MREECCSICLDPLYNNQNQPLRKLPGCGHLFHTKCVDAWLERKCVCPNCKLNLKRLVYPNSDSNSNDSYTESYSEDSSDSYDSPIDRSSSSEY